MCLSKLDEKTKEVTEGWKIFYRDMRPQFYCDRIRSVYGKLEVENPEAFVDSFPVNEWITDPQDIMLKDGHDNEYQSGFHFYLKKEDAEYLVRPTVEKLRKVKVKDITATGYTAFMANKSSIRAGVAREIYVIDE